ncbi:hypothetical protein [Yoonia sp.]|uniref:hypothetical protein n=1 Tax=Yoonia sp. TaxID=2212373 RepID=UPI002DF864D5|nr:hypothetical protein [Yoonia sp.]
MSQHEYPASGESVGLGEERSFAVQMFTARYDLIEDRICLNAVDATGAKQVIYLTRRLMDQLIPVFIKHLEEKTPKGVPTDVVQSMTQERVRQVRKAETPARPVNTDLETPRWLCTTMQMRKQPAGLLMMLTGDAACNAQIPLTDQQLRAVLDIFRNAYAKAGWDLYLFPEWLAPAKAEVGLGVQVRLN